MRAPLRLDIRKRDLMRAGWYLAWAYGKRGAVQAIGRRWAALGGTHAPIVTLSARSGLDLYLQARRLPRGSEVAISAITHLDMADILKAHGLLPVPVDVEPQSLNPSLDSLHRAISPRTRAFLVAHLLGGAAPRQPLLDVCREQGIELWEDCAQRFPAVSAPCKLAPVAFYSFGPLKTATSLVGGVVDVWDSELREQMLGIQSKYPRLPRTQLALRTSKYAALASLSAHPGLYGAAFRSLQQVGADPRQVLRGATRSFGQHWDLEQLRYQPGPPSLRMIAHRLTGDTSHASQRAAVARRLIEELGRERVLGSLQDSQHWLLVLRAAEPEAMQQRLVRAGFDAWRGISNLGVVQAPEGRPQLSTRAAREVLDSALMVPLHPDYETSELARLSQCIPSCPPTSSA